MTTSRPLLALLLTCFCYQVSGQCTAQAWVSDSEQPYNSSWVSDFNKVSGKLHLSGQFGESLFSFGDHQLQSLFLPTGYSNSFLMQMDNEGEVDWVKHMGKKYTSTLRGRLTSVDDGVVSAFGFNDTAIVEGLPYIT